jgi:hypothetical protein
VKNVYRLPFTPPSLVRHFGPSTLALIFDFAGGRHGGLLVDRLWSLSTYDRRSKVVPQPHFGDDQRVHHFWG